jgi:hypothetical protein
LEEAINAVPPPPPHAKDLQKVLYLEGNFLFLKNKNHAIVLN